MIFLDRNVPNSIGHREITRVMKDSGLVITWILHLKSVLIVNSCFCVRFHPKFFFASGLVRTRARLWLARHF